MKIIAMANQKGGVGKTASAVSMAAALHSHHRKRVLLCDLDAQANASTWLTSKAGQPGRSTYDVIMQTASLPDCIVKTPSRIDLLPSNLKTANLDVELLGIISFHERLAEAIPDLREDAYDYCILDCPPNLSMNTLNAFGRRHPRRGQAGGIRRCLTPDEHAVEGHSRQGEDHALRAHDFYESYQPGARHSRHDAGAIPVALSIAHSPEHPARRGVRSAQNDF